MIAQAAAPGTPATLVPAAATRLRELSERLARAPRRRDFRSVPMILDTPDLWDHEALSAVIAYSGSAKQVWDSKDVDGPWLNLMRNAVNTQVWSFRHPDFLAVSMTHGTAQLALHDEAMWDKYKLAQLANRAVATNDLAVDAKGARSDPAAFEDPAGVFSENDNSIPALMRRGVVFGACHNAIWEHSAALIRKGINPDRLSLGALAAELTNHLLPGVVLTPGAVGTLPELQRAGFQYAT